MRAIKLLPAVLFLTLAAPALARPADGRPARPAASAAHKPAAGKAAAKKQGERHKARLTEAMKAQGIDDARAQKVLAVIDKYKGERTRIREESKKHRQALRQLIETNSTDQAAYSRAMDGLKAAAKKRAEVNDKQHAEIATILKPSEQAKLARVMQRAKNKGHGKGAAKKAENPRKGARF